jgi:general secretion pathway protein D
MTNKLAEDVLDDNTVLIYPATAEKLRDYQQQVVKSFYLANADVKKTVEMIKTILRTKDVFIDDKTNLLVMRDTPEVVRLAEKLIATEDIPVPEVELEVEVMEVNSDHLLNLGLQYPQQVSASLGNAGSFPAGPHASGFVTYQVSNPALTLNLLNTDSDSRLLANPKIRVKDRDKAKIHIGQKLPVLTTVATAGVGSSQTVTYLDVGLKLDVEPSIRLDEQVDMKVTLEVSSVNQTITLTDGSQVYQLATRDAETTLRLKDGETQILAGLIQNNETAAINRVPGLGDVPLLGRLFSNDKNEKTKTELMLLITPHVVRDVTRPDEVLSEFSAGTEGIPGGGSSSRDIRPAAPVPAEAPAPAPAPNPPSAPNPAPALAPASAPVASVSAAQPATRTEQ